MQDCINIYNGGVLAVSIDQVIDSLYSDRITGELTLSFTSKVERIPEITGDTLIEFRGQYFRAVQVQYSAADGAFLLTVSCEQETMTLVDDELPLFEFSGTPGAALASLLSGTGISGTSEYTDTIQLKEENTNRRAVMIVIRGMAGGEIEYIGHTVRIVKHRGRTEPRKLIGLMQCTDIARNVDLQTGTESFEITGWKPGDFGVGDEVILDFAPLNTNTQRRIIGISYNPFNCTSVSVEVGDFVPDILDSYREVIEDSEEANGRLDKIDEKIGDTVKKSELSAGIDTYINEERGRASIVAALKGTYVETDVLTGYTKKTELSAEIGAYIDTESGTAKIVNKLMGTFVKTDALGNYVAKSDLSAGIESYIDTAAGTAKVVSAVSGTYVTQSGLTGTLGDYAKKGDLPDVSGYVEKTELSAEIGAYIDTESGKAKVVSAVSGTYQKKSDMSGYVTTANLNTSIGQYIDSATGKVKIVSACSGTYLTQSDLSGYALKTAVTTEISQAVSPLEGKISLTSAYGSGTIGSNVRALLTLVTNPDSSSIKLSADAISLVGTVYMKSSDYVAAGTTMIKGSKIQTDDLYLKQLRASNGDYIIDYYGSTLAIGGGTGAATGSFANFSYIDMMASTAIRIGVTSAYVTFVYESGKYTLRAYDSNKIFYIGSSVYPVDAIYCDTLYVGGKSVTGSASDSSSLKATDIKAVYAESSSTNRLTLNSSNYFIPGNSSAYYLGSTVYPFRGLYLGTSSYYWVMDANGIIPNYKTSSYFNIGSSTKPVSTIYATAIYLNGTALTASGSSSGSTSADFSGKAVKLGGSTSYYIQATTSRQLCPNTSSTSYPFYLGTSGYYWHYAYIGSVETHIGDDQYSKLGFFGKTAVARQTVSNTATVATLITALKAYGLIY